MKTAANLIKSGIDVIGDIPWGTHVCQFYQTKEDLVDILVPYFKAGLENNESCIWVTSWPLDVEDAKTSLRKAKSNLDDYIGKGQIDILDYRGWYFRSGKFDADDVLQSWIEKEKIAREKGFKGLRVSSNLSWLAGKDWGDFQNYEAKFLDVIGKYQVIASCSYHLNRCRVSDIVEVVDNHESALFKREGKWVLRDNTESSRIRHRLESSETRYRRLFETAQDGILILDADTGIIVDVNPFLIEMLGYTKEQFIGKRLWEIGPFKDIEASREAFKELNSKGYVRYEHLPLETKKGHQIAVEFVSNVYPIDGDRVIQCNIRDITDRKHAEDALATARNELEIRVKERTSQLAKANEELVQEINERKRAEHALKESEERFQSLTENTSDLVWEIDTSGVYTYVNPKVKDLLGYDPAEIVGKTKLHFMPEEEGANIAKEFRAIIKSRKPFVSLENTNLHKDGRSIVLETNGVPFFYPDGRLCGYRGVDRDITERKRAEEEVIFKAKVLDAAIDSIIVFDSNQTIVYANEAASSFHGYTKEKIIGKTFKNISPAKEVEKYFSSRLRKLKKTGDAFFETVDLCVDKSTIPVEVRLNLIVLNGKTFYISISRDITERKQAEEELQKVAKLESISTLAGGIAHDFNNLLTGILGNITLAERYVEKGGKIHGRLVDAERASLRAKDLTQQLLTFSGGGIPITKPASIAALVKESASFALSGSNVKCDFCLPDDLWAVEVDKD